MIRRRIALLLTLSTLANFAYAGTSTQSIHLNGKASQKLIEKMSAGKPQDFIVVYDDKAIELEAKVIESQEHIPSHHHHVIEHKVARYAEEKQKVHANFGSDEATVLKNYSHLPVSFVHIHSMAALNKLLAQSGVVSIYENAERHLMLAESLPLIGQPQVATQGNSGAGTAIAVLDTGANYTLPAFGSCTSPGVPAGCKVVYAQDFAPNDGSLDDNGHGTNVAGIVAGVAPDAKIVALDVFGAGGTASDSDILAAVNWVIANKTSYNIVAINMSLGSGQYFSPLVGSVYNTSVDQARAAGILTVAASGNDGYTNSMAIPAAIAGVISVGAVYDSPMGTMSWTQPAFCSDMTTSASMVTCFSNSASFLTLLAPGSQILAAGTSMSGTSQASPHVAGAIAILRAAFPNESLDQTIARLTNGIVVLDSRNGIAKPRLNLPMALCSYTLSATSQSYSANSTNDSVAVTTSAGCLWNAASTSSSSWISIISGSSGNGNGTVTYSVTANFNPASRTGYITIAGQTYIVYQSGYIAPLATNILLNSGFEDGSSGWVTSAANGSKLMTAHQNPTTGNSWYVSLCGYDNCADSIYQDVTIPADAQSAVLQYQYSITTFESFVFLDVYDLMRVKIFSPPSANTYVICNTLSNLNASTSWLSSPYCDLIGYKGQSIRIELAATTDTALATSFYIDNVTLNVSGSAFTDYQPPTVPTGLTATAISSSRIDLTWTASTDNVGVATYKIYNSGTLVSTVGNVTSSSIASLPATTYSYTVSACDIVDNCSAQSSSALVTTPNNYGSNIDIDLDGPGPRRKK